ncbi:putative transporter [Exophiala dermatitidis]
MDSSPYKERIDHIETKHEHAEAEADAKADKANEILKNESSGQRIVLTPENNARVLRKIDLYILPVILGIYLLQALDKATLSYASVFGLVEDVHLVGHQYSWLGAIVYLAQLVAQPFIAYLLVKLPLGKFVAAIVLLWGISLSAMVAAHNFAGLLVARLFLGLFEAGVAPAFIALSQMWWRRREQPVRIAVWYASNGICNVFGSLLTYGIGHIHSSVLKSYQIIFLFFGLITVAYSVLVLFVLPDSPVTARFLKGEDKLVAIERLRANNQGVDGNRWDWGHVKEAALDLKTWMWAAMMFAISVPSGGISTFGPLIVKNFGFDKFQTILLNMPFGAVQLISTMGGAWAATKLKMKSPVLAFLSLPPIAGCVTLLYLPRDASARAPLLIAYYIISVYPGITPLIYSWSAANTAGETKKKVTTGALFVAQCAGNVLGPNLYTIGEAPLYHRGLMSNLALFVGLIGLYGVTVVYLIMLNRRHGKTRVSMGKKAVLVDQSMERVKHATADDEAQDVPIGEHAFTDRTDFQNEDFIFVY